jgi:hypothetical protein
MRQSETEVQQSSHEKTNLIYSFAFLARFCLKIVPTNYERDVTIEDEIAPVNLLCSSKVTYPTDTVMPRTIEVTELILRNGQQSLSDSVVERFVAKSADNGMDVFRVFDALNDVPNVKCTIATVKKAGKTRKERSASATR